MTLVGRFGPPLALMAVIFALSAQADLNSGLGLVDHLGRKLMHMAEYGLLFVLWWRALRWRLPAVAAAITIAYSASDEFHQTFVHGRVGTPVDVVIDAAGVLVAYLIVRGVAARRRSGGGHGEREHRAARLGPELALVDDARGDEPRPGA
jgi:VanZ family protein